MVNDDKFSITILNLFKEKECGYRNIIQVRGDACNMSEFKDVEFDIAFSNSVIEHINSFDQQGKMARELRRVAKGYFLQTPNYWFPIEPHFLMPGFQFLPLKVKAFLVRHFNLGWYKKESDYNKSFEVASCIRLLKLKEIKELFPGATIRREKFLGLTKSFMVFKGPDK